jgi:site-specific recombinase XerD
MLSVYFDPGGRRIRALRDAPTGTLFDGFAHALSETGYATITARRYLRAAEHFIHWTDRNRLPVQGVNEESLAQFGRHLGRCRCPHQGHADRASLAQGTRVFLKYLRDTGISTTFPLTPPVVSDPILVSRFCQWMRLQRGTCDATLSRHRRYGRELLKQLGEVPSQWNAQGLRAFVLEQSHRCGWATVQSCATTLRMFVRFLIADGLCAVRLDAAIPRVAHWRLAALPRSLQPDDVERVIASCDPVSPVGRRDRAILLLLARLGLRAGDVAHLRLRDIDWQGAWIHVCGKSRRETRLPLSQEVGQAIVGYLQHGRPRITIDAVFVRCRAPLRALDSDGAVTAIVARALHRAGVTRPSRGAAHLLRHSVATSMLRHGASLQDIGALLRHRSIETTQIYAKVDVTALQPIAQPWPEVQPC